MNSEKPAAQARPTEWPTLALLALTYGLWAVATLWLAALWLPGAVMLVALTGALHSSLSHEALHGHPSRSALLNTALVFPALSLAIPYLRFRDTHLAHHHDAILTDPYDDPESNYIDPSVWAGLSAPMRLALRMNNTLAGRLLLGPVIGQIAFMQSDWSLRGHADVRRGWLWHLPSMALVLGWVWLSPMPLWAYLLGAYAALSILKIRTFLEHRAHDHSSARSVIIEDRGPLALIFLNNNLHVVHHMHPSLAWYDLPQLYARDRDRFLARNGGYAYRSYAQIFAAHLFRAKDPVAHPLWP